MLQLLGACTSVDKADRENDASDMPLGGKYVDQAVFGPSSFVFTLLELFRFRLFRFEYYYFLLWVGSFGHTSTTNRGTEGKMTGRNRAEPSGFLSVLRQLSAFEFRQYQTSLESSQQRLVERVVNQWVAMLVKARSPWFDSFPVFSFRDDGRSEK